MLFKELLTAEAPVYSYYIQAGIHTSLHIYI